MKDRPFLGVDICFCHPIRADGNTILIQKSETTTEFPSQSTILCGFLLAVESKSELVGTTVYVDGSQSREIELLISDRLTILFRFMLRTPAKRI